MPTPDLRKIGEGENLYTCEPLEHFKKHHGIKILRDLSAVEIAGCGSSIKFPRHIWEKIQECESTAEKIIFEWEWLNAQGFDVTVSILGTDVQISF